MSKSIILLIFSIFFMLIGLYPAHAGPRVHGDSIRIKPYLVSSHTYDPYYSDKAFDYQTNKSSNTSLWNLWWLKLMKLLNPLYSHRIFSMLIYGFFIAIFIILIIILIGGDFQSIIQRKRTFKSDLAVFDEEDSVTDLDAQIQNAINEGNYTKATRLKYLKILRMLNTYHLISLQKEKTNRDYQIELIHTKYYIPFKQITTFYEYTWYGKFPVTTSEYSIYEKEVYELNHILDAR